MNILALDTAGECCSAAVWCDAQCVSRSEVAPNQHSQRILPMAHACLDEARLSLQDIGVIAVDIGPGSFTGIRIGVGVAQGLAYALGVNCIGVGSLGALAWDALDADDARIALPMIDARMSQVYWGAYQKTAAGLREIVPPSLDFPADVALPDSARAPIVTAGNGWTQYADDLPSALGKCALPAHAFPQAEAIAWIASQQLSAAVAPVKLAPHYVRDNVAKVKGAK